MGGIEMIAKEKRGEERWEYIDINLCQLSTENPELLEVRCENLVRVLSLVEGNWRRGRIVPLSLFNLCVVGRGYKIKKRRGVCNGRKPDSCETFRMGERDHSSFPSKSNLSKNIGYESELYNYK